MASSPPVDGDLESQFIPGAGHPRSGDDEDALSGSSWLFVAVLVVAGPVAVGVVAASEASATAASIALHVLAYALALAPSFAIFVLVRRRLRDPAVDVNFLVGQVVWTAVPAMLAVFVVELLLLAAFVAALFRNEIRTAAQLLAPHKNGPTAPDLDDQLQSLIASLPAWKIALTILWNAYIVAAATEELTKLLLSRRYKSLSAPHLTSHGVLSVAAAAGLGFAGAEHLAYAMSYAGSAGPVAGAAMGLFRALFAFPVHVGTAVWMGLCMARWVGWRESVSVAWLWGVPVGVHGTVDLVAFVFWAVGGGADSALGGVVVVVVPPLLQLGLTVALVQLCRREYAKLMTRERGGILEG